MKKIAIATALAGLATLMTGCATIMGSEVHNMAISSTPSDATIRITDEKGTAIFQGKTPTTVTLTKTDGSYFGKKTYSVLISKPGYENQTIPVTASPTGWYIGGNLLFGGLIGWLIVDPLSGKMYNLTPETISANLPEGAKGTHNNTSKDGGVTVMLVQDVPLELRDKMKALN